MKKIFLLLLMVVAFTTAFSQTDDTTKYTHYRYLYGNRTARVWADSVITIPGDTATGAKVNSLGIKSGTLYYKTAVKWEPIVGVGGGGGVSNANVGAGFRILKPASQELKTLFAANGILIDSTSNTDGLTFRVDSSIYSTNANVQQKYDQLSSKTVAVTGGDNITVSGAAQQVGSNPAFTVADAGKNYRNVTQLSDSSYVIIRPDGTRDTIEISITGTMGGSGGADGNNYVNGASFSSASGDLTLTRQGLSSISTNIDGRYVRITDSTSGGYYPYSTNPKGYLTSYTETDPDYNANGVPKTRTLTINGTALDLSENRSWTTPNTFLNAASFSGGILTLTRNDAGTVTTSLDGRYLQNITGYISAGTNVSLSGTGTSGDPYIITAAGGTGGDGNNYPTAVAFSTSTGALTISRNGFSDIGTNLDGRYIQNITNHISAGSNITITGSGTTAAPYVINSSLDGNNYSTGVSFNSTDGNLTISRNGLTNISTSMDGRYYLSSNPSGYISNITGLVTAGTNVTISGSGTSASPYSIAATGDGNNYTTNSTFSKPVSGTIRLTTTRNGLSNLTADVVLASGDITTALGFTPYNSTNPSGFISNITGLLSAGTNISISGSGTSASPYVINSTGASTPSLQQVTDIGASTNRAITLNGGIDAIHTGLIIGTTSTGYNGGKIDFIGANGTVANVQGHFTASNVGGITLFGYSGGTTEVANFFPGSSRIAALSGSGSRMVVADASGNLSTQAIPAGGSGEANTGINVGTGAGVYYGKQGVQLEFKSIQAGSNISVTDNTGTITINSLAEANTGFNLSMEKSGAIGLYHGKTSSTLNFKSILSGYNMAVSNEPDGNSIRITAAFNTTSAPLSYNPNIPQAWIEITTTTGAVYKIPVWTAAGNM